MLLSCSGGTQGHAQAAMIHITEDASLSLERPSGREQPHTLAHIGPRPQVHEQLWRAARCFCLCLGVSQTRWRCPSASSMRKGRKMPWKFGAAFFA